MNDQSPDPLPTAAEAAVASGRILKAIQILRDTEGVGLDDARRRVQQYLERDPELRERVERRARALRLTIIKWALVVDVVLVLLFMYWFFGRR